MSARREALAWLDRARCATEVGKQFDQLELDDQRELCDRCPVRAECLVDVLEWELPLGRNQIQHLAATVAGGLDLDERLELEDRILRVATSDKSAALLLGALLSDLTPQQLGRVIDAADVDRRNTAGGSKPRAA